MGYKTYPFAEWRDGTEEVWLGQDRAHAPLTLLLSVISFLSGLLSTLRLSG